LLQRLAHGPATSGQLAELLSVSRPATSQHLQVLHAAGLVRSTALGRNRWHELAPGPLYLVGRTMHHANRPRVVAGEPLRGCLAVSRMK
jgi:DNA-binding transcriptional ArsR family regulator